MMAGCHKHPVKEEPVPSVYEILLAEYETTWGLRRTGNKDKLRDLGVLLSALRPNSPWKCKSWKTSSAFNAQGIFRSPKHDMKRRRRQLVAWDSKRLIIGKDDQDADVIKRIKALQRLRVKVKSHGRDRTAAYLERLECCADNTLYIEGQDEGQPSIQAAVWFEQTRQDWQPQAWFVSGIDNPAELNVVHVKFNGVAKRYADDMYARSVFADSVKLFRLLDDYSRKNAKRMAQDPAYLLAMSSNSTYAEKVARPYNVLSDSLDAALRIWSKGLVTLFPERTWWPDANLTLRLSYGKVEGAYPRDGIAYLPYTTLSGVIEKNVPGDPEFTVPQKLIDLYDAKDFGPYATDGAIRTCFLSSLHTTGGNSGSPVFNGQGELIGINFDRTWESTMSDIIFDPAKCRNISVDIKYVLFIIDKYLGGKHLVDEMELVGLDTPPHVIELPLHH